MVPQIMKATAGGSPSYGTSFHLVWDSDTLSVFRYRLKTCFLQPKICFLKFFGKLGCLDAVASLLSHVHSGLLTVDWPAALCPRVSSCLFYLPAHPFYLCCHSSSRRSPCLRTTYVKPSQDKSTPNNLCSLSRTSTPACHATGSSRDSGDPYSSLNSR